MVLISGNTPGNSESRQGMGETADRGGSPFGSNSGNEARPGLKQLAQSNDPACP